MKDDIKYALLTKFFRVEDNHLKLFGKISYTMYPARAMAITLQHIGRDKGQDFLFELGFEAGDDAGKEMMEDMALASKSYEERMKSILFLLEFIGFGKPDVKIFDPGKGKFSCHVTNHPVIENAKKLFGAESKVCGFYRGVYSAHLQRELGIKNARCIETKCVCKGDPFCEWSSGVF